MTTSSNTEVIGAVYAGTWRHMAGQVLPPDTLSFLAGKAVPGTWDIDPDTVTLQKVGKNMPELLTQTILKDADDKDYSVVRYSAHPYALDPGYAMVGLRFSTVDKALYIEPLVALYDVETGTTSWNGTTGQLWAAVAKEPIVPSVYRLPESRRYAARSLPQDARHPKPMIATGLRLSMHLNADGLHTAFAPTRGFTHV
ncbi:MULTISPECIES: hypothetical protein [unclassified Streptomyces]|uniref:hypothetical protein n=1 Tax=unclassified Streptomyces TaxID=2593676 RepID=UPI00226F5190|nr:MULTISPECIES: hypothetical protein [unclassified Streptomyces]MCY0924130.1 hypothetical protein [Streptomyces sp. H27-G5]MCY0963164.1 hypothetical protein [Streptomyces sp. H27-H5]